MVKVQFKYEAPGEVLDVPVREFPTAKDASISISKALLDGAASGHQDIPGEKVTIIIEVLGGPNA